jgi:hypothetical protein
MEWRLSRICAKNSATIEWTAIKPMLPNKASAFGVQ